MKQLAIALDQLLNVIAGGWADETISARAWRMQNRTPLWCTVRRLIDALFFWQPSHCHDAWIAEKLRLHLPPEDR